MTKGYKHTKETRKKMSETRKKMGTKPPSNFGKKLSEGTKRKISNAHRGMKASDEVKAKMSKRMMGTKLHLGHFHTKESKEKNRLAHLGKKATIETRLKMRKAMLGKNSKGGITPINQTIRTSLEYRLWRESVFKRDNFTCRFCGKRGGKLNADHIKRFSDYPELRFAIDNGRTLCVPCHKKTYTYGSKKKI